MPKRRAGDYRLRNRVVKDRFNAWVIECVLGFMNPRLQYTIHAMEARYAATYTALKACPTLNAYALTLFTCSRSDARALTRAVDCDVRLITAEALYAEPQFAVGPHIVIDDGMQKYKKTYARVQTLLGQKPAELILACNISLRNLRAGMTSVYKFQRMVRRYAEYLGYSVRYRIMPSYSQLEGTRWAHLGRMHPICMLFTRA